MRRISFERAEEADKGLLQIFSKFSLAETNVCNTMGFGCAAQQVWIMKLIWLISYLWYDSKAAWLRRQQTDFYNRLAVRDDYRSRSAYKLIQIQNEYQLIKPGQIIVDCGAAPGGWSQVAARIFQEEPLTLDGSSSIINATSTDRLASHIIAIDRLRMDPIEGVHLLTPMDFLSQQTTQRVTEYLKGRQVDLILSDMAPNLTGQREADHFRSIVRITQHSLCFIIL